MANPKVVPVTDEDIKLALAGASSTTVETNEDPYELTESKQSTQDTGNVRHTTGIKVKMYKPLNNGHYTPRLVPYKNLPMLIQNGWKAKCPDCGSDNCSGVPNECAGNKGIKFRSCPRCGKRIYDDPVAYKEIVLQVEGEEDENEIRDEEYVASTPESRTKSLLDQHILAYHPAEAGFYGVAVIDPRKQPNNVR